MWCHSLRTRPNHCQVSHGPNQADQRDGRSANRRKSHDRKTLRCCVSTGQVVLKCIPPIATYNAGSNHLSLTLALDPGPLVQVTHGTGSWSVGAGDPSPSKAPLASSSQQSTPNKLLPTDDDKAWKAWWRSLGTVPREASSQTGS